MKKDIEMLKFRVGRDTAVCVPVKQACIHGSHGARVEPAVALVYLFDAAVVPMAMAMLDRFGPGSVSIAYHASFAAYVRTDGEMVVVKNRGGPLDGTPAWLSDILDGDAMTRMRTLSALGEL